jgi:hypothetical protein
MSRRRRLCLASPSSSRVVAVRPSQAAPCRCPGRMQPSTQSPSPVAADAAAVSCRRRLEQLAFDPVASSVSFPGRGRRRKAGNGRDFYRVRPNRTVLRSPNRFLTGPEWRKRTRPQVRSVTLKRVPSSFPLRPYPLPFSLLLALGSVPVGGAGGLPPLGRPVGHREMVETVILLSAGRVGLRFSKVRVPGGEALVSVSSWNKSPLALPCPVGVLL